MNIEFDTAVRKIKKIDLIVRQLDESIRPLAFQMLANATESDLSGGKQTLPLAGLASFAACHSSGTPAQNMLAMTAWIHLHDSDCLITPQKIKALANVCGLTVPRRPDCTLRYASHKGNRLFMRQGYGWQLTVYGSAYVTNAYGINSTDARQSATARIGLPT
jgi:hypothetical protein